VSVSFLGLSVGFRLPVNCYSFLSWLSSRADRCYVSAGYGQELRYFLLVLPTKPFVTFDLIGNKCLER
jgi:hypothetical protein